MANMSYCRFENTARDLRDCVQAINNGETDELNNYVHALNKVFVRDDVYLIASYPDDEVIEFLESDDFEPDNNFYMVLIQSYQKLEDGSSSLSKTNYYEHWSDEYYADTVLVRKQYGDIHGRNEKKS